MSDVTIILGGWAVFAAGIPVAIYRRQLAVLLWMAAMGTVLLPLFAAGHAAVYVGTAYLCVLLTCWAWTMPRQGRSELAGSALTSPLIALALVAALSAVSGAVTYDPAVTPRHGSILVVIYATALVVLSPAAWAILICSL